MFPFLGVRFIAINDSYDSIDRNQSDSLIIPFKNYVATVGNVNEETIRKYIQEQEENDKVGYPQH